ncbi:MAG TPA: interleukin-like EMT inducer domain-containing protein, partial [Anaerolineae bacterium]|nr:interleukin-like EMT inducer domain-containing protein [Anaerolineae bacterium]
LPTADMRIPAIYDVMAAEPAGGAVLDLPLGWRNGFSVFGKQDLIIMSQQWWQTRHGQPILGGNTSRNPEHKFRYFLEAPLIGPLTVLANATEANQHIQQQMADGLAALRDGDSALGGDPVLLAAAADGPAVLQALDIGYVVLHTDRVPPEMVDFVERYLPVRFVAEDGTHRLYRVDQAPPPAEVTVWPGRDALSRGEGWGGLGQARLEEALPDETPALWAQRRETRLLLPPVQPGASSVTVRAAAAGPGQTLALRVNGVDTSAQPLPEAWSERSFDLPAGALGAGVNDIQLRFGQTYPVETALVDSPAGLLVESAGLEAGNYAHIWLNGVDIAPNERGYNLALIDGTTWQPRAVAAFDTHADSTASAALVQFLDQMDDDSVLAVAVKDTASDQLSDEAAHALAALGLNDLQDRFRWGQAAIVLGANLASGQRQVVEQINGLQAVSAGYGPGWREPQAAAEVAWLRVE